MAFMTFSREFETEADLLGLQYLWKAGYDPSASIDLFEALESTERRQPGSVAKLFRTHPLTPDRIAKTQKNIDALLPAARQRCETVPDTSAYTRPHRKDAEEYRRSSAGPRRIHD